MAAFRLRGRLRVEEVAVDHDSALELAAVTGLTAYDASYLWLSRQLGAELVTLDRQLAKAATAADHGTASLVTRRRHVAMRNGQGEVSSATLLAKPCGTSK